MAAGSKLQLTLEQRVQAAAAATLTRQCRGCPNEFEVPRRYTYGPRQWYWCLDCRTDGLASQRWRARVVRLHCDAPGCRMVFERFADSMGSGRQYCSTACAGHGRAHFGSKAGGTA